MLGWVRMGRCGDGAEACKGGKWYQADGAADGRGLGGRLKEQRAHRVVLCGAGRNYTSGHVLYWG